MSQISTSYSWEGNDRYGSCNTLVRFCQKRRSHRHPNLPSVQDIITKRRNSLFGQKEEHIYWLSSSRSRYRPLFSIGAQANCEHLKTCHGRSEIIAYSIGHFGGRSFAGGRQGATPRPDFDYAECGETRRSYSGSSCTVPGRGG